MRNRPVHSFNEPCPVGYIRKGEGGFSLRQVRGSSGEGRVLVRKRGGFHGSSPGGGAAGYVPDLVDAVELALLAAAGDGGRAEGGPAWVGPLAGVGAVKGIRLAVIVGQQDRVRPVVVVNDHALGVLGQHVQQIGPLGLQAPDAVGIQVAGGDAKAVVGEIPEQARAAPGPGTHGRFGDIAPGGVPVQNGLPAQHHDTGNQGTGVIGLLSKEHVAVRDTYRRCRRQAPQEQYQGQDKGHRSLLHL